jgi:histidyl-tRNA synthetase
MGLCDKSPLFRSFGKSVTKRYKALRGTRDVLPEEVSRWQFLERTARSVFARYGFQEIRTPVFEATELFSRSVGESSDIVRKEMYTFDRGGDSMTLRPENTASVVRAFVEHSLFRNVASGYPERYYYIGPMFRHERPQKGRQRQFHQVGVEVLGSAEPLVDAETIQMVETFLDELGVGAHELVIGSVGDATCRPGYRAALKKWLEPRLDQLCEDCHRRFKENPLRVFDCKIERDQQMLSEAPVVLDLLCGPCEAHFAEVRRILDRYGVQYRVEPRLVRGLDYYERTVFEVLSDRLGAQNAILGGGRYDGLAEELGGPSVPGLGFAMGIERTILLLPEQRGARPGFDVALVALGRDGWETAIEMAQRLRAARLSVVFPVSERPMGAQLRRADKAGARFAVFVGADEIAAGTYGVKDLRTGDQQSMDEKAIITRCGEEHD